MQTTAEIQALLDKYLGDRMTRNERLRLKNLLALSSSDDKIAAAIEIVLKQDRYQETSALDKEELFQHLMGKAQLATTTAAVATSHRIHFLKTAWFKYAAVIVVALGLGIIAYFLTIRKNAEQTIAGGNKKWQTDVAPGGEKAVLTLADGTKITLDNAANGHLAQQGNTQVVKLANGQIAYNIKGVSGKDVLWNTMSTPVGGQYQVTLPDGTKVWLNAASSITYPAAFVSKNRQVKITGEAYFEVTKNKERPFLVDIDGKSTVEVLGTRFNIDSYQDEGAIKTTLLEGKVKIVSNQQPNTSIILKPGYRAVVTPSGQQPQVMAADPDQTLAWKNGLFSFNDADLRSVMRQLERWYGIKVTYEGKVPDVTLKGKMYRNVNLSVVLDFLQRMGVKFRTEGKTIIVF